MSPPRTHRRIVFSLVPFVGLALLAEGTARIAEARYAFSESLAVAVGLMGFRNEPILGDPAAESGPILVREESGRDAGAEPYVIGGVVIDGAAPSRDRRSLAAPAPTGREIFVVGGSAAFGFPYPAEDGFAERLAERLGGDYHVRNAAGVGQPSGELRPVVRRIAAEHRPDWLIVFSGNNEWIRWTLPTQLQLSERRLQVFRAAERSRFLAALLLWSIRSSGNRFRATGFAKSDFARHRELWGAAYALEHPSDELGYDASTWPETKRRYLEAFEANLTAIANDARAAGTRVVFMTMPFNYKLSPAWKHPQPESLDPRHVAATRAAVRRAANALARGAAREALAVCRTALALDPGVPILHYLRAQSHDALGQPGEAEQAYAASREAMVGNLGSMLSINEVIRRVAADTGSELVDLRAVFDRVQHELGGTANADLIQDDCHPNPRGHRIIAGELHRLIASR